MVPPGVSGRRRGDRRAQGFFALEGRARVKAEEVVFRIIEAADVGVEKDASLEFPDPRLDRGIRFLHSSSRGVVLDDFGDVDVREERRERFSAIRFSSSIEAIELRRRDVDLGRGRVEGFSEAKVATQSARQGAFRDEFRFVVIRAFDACVIIVSFSRLGGDGDGGVRRSRGGVRDGHEESGGVVVASTVESLKMMKTGADLGEEFGVLREPILRLFVVDQEEESGQDDLITRTIDAHGAGEGLGDQPFQVAIAKGAVRHVDVVEEAEQGDCLTDASNGEEDERVGEGWVAFQGSRAIILEVSSMDDGAKRQDDVVAVGRVIFQDREKNASVQKGQVRISKDDVGNFGGKGLSRLDKGHGVHGGDVDGLREIDGHLVLEGGGGKFLLVVDRDLAQKNQVGD